MSRLKIGIIGLGVMGKNHFNELIKKDILLFLHDISLPNWLKDSDDLNCENIKFFDNLQDFLNNDLDGVIISTPTKFHFEVFSKIALKVKNILIEKPLSLDLNQCFKMQELSQDNNVCVGFCERFSPVSMAFKNESAGEKILWASFLRASRYPSRINDVGVDLDLCVHDIDLANFFGILPKKYDKNELIVKKSFKNKLCSQISIVFDSLQITSSWEFNSRIRKAFVNTDKSSYELDFLKGILIKDEKQINIIPFSNLSKEHDAFFEMIKCGKMPKNSYLASINDAVLTQQIIQ